MPNFTSNDKCITKTTTQEKFGNSLDLKKVDSNNANLGALNICSTVFEPYVQKILLTLKSENMFEFQF